MKLALELENARSERVRSAADRGDEARIAQLLHVAVCHRTREVKTHRNVLDVQRCRLDAEEIEDVEHAGDAGPAIRDGGLRVCPTAACPPVRREVGPFARRGRLLPVRAPAHPSLCP